MGRPSEHDPQSAHRIISALLKESGRDTSEYIRSFLSVDIPSIEFLKELQPNEEKRARRKILMYWSVLHRAGYPVDYGKLRTLIRVDPEFNQNVRKTVYRVNNLGDCPNINSLEALASEFEKCAEANRDTKLISSSGNNLFDADDEAILGFLRPSSSISTGPGIIRPFRKYHDPAAGDFVTEIISLLDDGETVILDLGNAPPEVMEYFSAHHADFFSHALCDFCA